MFIDTAGLVIDDGAHVLNNRGFGEVGEGMSQVHFETGLRRPFLHGGTGYVTVNTGRQKYNEKKKRYEPVYADITLRNLRRQHDIHLPFPTNNASLLQKDAWIEIDRTVVRATRQRLRAWTDLVTRNPRRGFNAMSKLTLEYQNMTDVGEAIVDMDGISEGRTTRPALGLLSVPLPITHSDFWFSQREIAVSKQTSTPLDTTMIEMAGRRIAETIEKTLIGVETGMTAGTRSTGPFPHTGTSTVYGYTNFPYRVTKTDLNTPTGTNPEAVMVDILEMIEVMQSNGFFGPYMIYHSTPYSRYLNDDYFRSGSTSAVRLLRERILAIEGIEGIRRLDFLTSGYQLILIQMTPEVAQAIDGMSIQTVMWEMKGGMELHFKVMCIQVPLLKTPPNGISGIMHATTS